MADVLSPVVGSAANKPNLFLETYGVSYGLDIFALGHNAVRRDLNDIYDVLYAFELRRGDVHLSDVAEFFKWFKPVAKFIRDIFELEVRMLKSSLTYEHCILKVFASLFILFRFIRSVSSFHGLPLPPRGSRERWEVQKDLH